MRRRLLAVFPVFLCVALWWVLAWQNHARVIPTPAQTLCALARLLGTNSAWRDLGLTLLRGACGVFVGGTLAVSAGILCGRKPALHDALMPVVTLGQSCPPIVWISLLLVWLSIGGAVPVTVAILSVFPVLFVNVANATRALDPKWFEVARVYRVSRWRRLTKIILPGISSGLAAGFSYAFGIAWKVTATAEFFGAQDGIGARIYDSYRRLDLPQLFAWTLLVACLGVVLETFLVRRIRKWNS